MQNQVIQYEKFASLGRMTSRVFHEMLNPLHIISGYIQMMQVDSGVAAIAGKHLDTMKNESDRLTHIIKSLLQYSSFGRKELRPINLNSLIESFVMNFNIETGSEPVIVHYTASGIHQIIGETDRLFHLFKSLIENSLESMPTGGIIHIDQDLSITEQDETGKKAVVAVRLSDTGCGISKDHLRSVFDPFFTTKPVGEGLGVNLSLCYAAVRSMDGSITVDSEPDVGTTFTILLPVLEKIVQSNTV